MARFQFRLNAFVGWPASHPVVSQRTLQALRLAEVAQAHEANEAHDAPRGPGWFDSSWELVRGLEVCEGLPGDARLHEWLEACLRAEPAAASSVAERNEQPGARLVPAPAHGALVDALQFGDLELAVAAEVAHLDEFGEFGIDGLELA